FRRCPRQYWYRHVAGVPERGAGGARAAWLGTAAHAILEHLPDEADVEALLAARPEALFLRPHELRALGADLRAALHTLAAQRDLEWLGREIPFVLGLPHGAPRLFLHGRIDAIGRRHGVPVVRDFKYAAASDAAVTSYAPQIAAYRLAVLAGSDGQVNGELVF